MRPGKVTTVLFAILLLSSCGNPSGSNPTTLSGIEPQNVDPEPAVVPVNFLNTDLAALKEEILSLEAMVWAECMENCKPPKKKHLIKKNKVNKLGDEEIGVEVDDGYSWDKEKYFQGKTMEDFLRELFKGETLSYKIDKLCVLTELLLDEYGLFVEGVYPVDLFALHNAEAYCGLNPGDLDLGTTVTVENIDVGGFEQKIVLDSEKFFLKVTPEVFAFGHFSSTARRRLTYDKVKENLSIEALKFLPGEDSLVRVFYDGVLEKVSLLNKAVAPQNLEIAYSAIMGDLVPRFGKLDIKAISLGGVEDIDPNAQACIDLVTGLISQYSYDDCPMDFGLGLIDTNPDLFAINYTPDPSIMEMVEFGMVDDVYLDDI